MGFYVVLHLITGFSFILSLQLQLLVFLFHWYFFLVSIPLVVLQFSSLPWLWLNSPLYFNFVCCLFLLQVIALYLLSFYNYNYRYCTYDHQLHIIPVLFVSAFPSSILNALKGFLLLLHHFEWHRMKYNFLLCVKWCFNFIIATLTHETCSLVSNLFPSLLRLLHMSKLDETSFDHVFRRWKTSW